MDPLSPLLRPRLQNTIAGSDFVSLEDTSPQRASVYRFKRIDHRHIGSGFILYPRLILTAGHVIQKIRNNSPAIAERGTGDTSSKILATLLAPRYEIERDKSWDIGAVVLESPVQLGVPLQLYVLPQESRASVNVIGFMQPDFFQSSGRLINATPERWIHSASTENGHSGAPLLLNSDLNKVVGVHTNGPGADAGQSVDYNSGVRMRDELLKLVQDWANSI